MASRLVNYGHMQTEQAAKYIDQYDGEFPAMYMPEVLEYLGMMPKEYIEAMEVHRDRSVWKQEEGGWVLK